MKLENITDVFFDLDHTLWDFEKNSDLAFQTIFKNHQLPVAVGDFLVHYPYINKKYWELFREDKISHNELRYFRLKETFDLLGVTILDDEIFAIADDYITLLPNSHFLYDGAIEVLEYLFPKYNLHIITNGLKNVQKRKIESSNLKKYFKTVTDSETTGYKKPNPIIFNHILQHLNLNPKNTVMIGDCIDADVNGALNVGMQAIHFDEFKTANHKDAIIITKLVELKNYL